MSSGTCEGDGEASCSAGTHNMSMRPEVDNLSAHSWQSQFVALQILLILWVVKHGASYCWSRVLVPGLQSLAVRLAAVGVLRDRHVIASVSSLCKLLDLRTTASTPAVELSDCVCDDEAEMLGNAICSPAARTQSLALRDNPALSADGVEVLCRSAFRHSSRLSALDLSLNPHFGDKVASSLVACASAWSTSLRNLQLMHCGLTVKGIEQLCPAMETCALRVLNLSYNQISGSGEFLASLCAAPLLEQLLLARCELSDKDVAELAADLPYSSLKTLDLEENLLTDVGASALAENVKKAPLLRILDLTRNAIAMGDGLGRLAGAWAEVPERVSGGHIAIEGNHLSCEEVRRFEDTLHTMTT
eukprot:CAMPEP_0117479650 /NCGR_PEP_ID=MMETSP0784-20121206/11992_1 /TAXON_ID=39447 /ORGANISM="" /LENGTH=359 /DNA_ID=CAMNT_0005274079 /DNA_START=74 /DNA_END=1153 /DNA_ORIENTATION=+